MIKKIPIYRVKNDWDSPNGFVPKYYVPEYNEETGCYLFVTENGKWEIHEENIYKISDVFEVQSLRTILTAGWISSSIQPEKPGLKHYEQIPCIVSQKGEMRILLWNCEHLCWDQEDGDDYECNLRDVDFYYPLSNLPPLPSTPQGGDNKIK